MREIVAYANSTMPAYVNTDKSFVIINKTFLEVFVANAVGVSIIEQPVAEAMRTSLLVGKIFFIVVHISYDNK
jgi:hypothetical protein